jgi:hypothetical protein
MSLALHFFTEALWIELLRIGEVLSIIVYSHHWYHHLDSFLHNYIRSGNLVCFSTFSIQYWQWWILP